MKHPGPVAQQLMELDKPQIDFCALAKGMGVPSERPDSAESFHAALRKSLG